MGLTIIILIIEGLLFPIILYFSTKHIETSSKKNIDKLQNQIITQHNRSIKNLYERMNKIDQKLDKCQICQIPEQS